MRLLNVDWSGQFAKAAKAGTRTRTHYHRERDAWSDRDDDALILTGRLGVAVWVVICLAIGLATQNIWIPGFVMFCAMRRTRMVSNSPTVWKSPGVMPASKPVAKPASKPVAPSNETSVTGVQISVYQAVDGPTVSVVTFPAGEILTRVCASWPAAGTYAGKIRKQYEALGVPVEFVQERI